MAEQEPAVKKMKLAVKSDGNSAVTVLSKDVIKPDDMEILKEEMEEMEHFKETDVGILAFISDLPGFQGIIKQRFSDFIVNEVNENGEVVHLTATSAKTEPNLETDKTVNLPSTEVQEPEEAGKPVEQTPVKCSQLPDAEVDELNKLLVSTDKSFTVTLQASDDKEKRCQIHRSIRMNFPNLESTTLEVDGKKVIQVKKIPASKKVKHKGGNRQGCYHQKRNWCGDKGDYCRFTLYKENKDTMDAIFKLAHMLHVNKGIFQYGGTKDRRAKTTQEVTAYKLRIEKLQAVSPILWNMKLGDFRYVEKPLRLGQICGNKFSIVLRNVTEPDNLKIDKAMMSLRDYGFINYFGMQRFGTTSIPTYHIGRAILNSEWEEAVNLIMKPRPWEYGEIAECRRVWWEKRDCSAALKVYPKRYSIERTLLAALKKNSRNFCGAFGMIPRNTRLMYLHSYQSYIWNCVVSRRIQEFGMRPVVGDLVLPQESESMDVEQNLEREEGDDENNGKRFQTQPIVVDQSNLNDYTIYDVVMTIPGYDVIYPENAVKNWVTEILEKDNLTIENFRHKNKQYMLKGTYRKMLTRPKDVTWQTYLYNDVMQPIVLSDMDRLEGKPEPQSIPGGSLKALKLEMTLPPACYATMALREVLKMDTSSAHQSTLNQTAQDVKTSDDNMKDTMT
ncbi:pseudouridylate synthase 7 homolog [Ylistrum balloti]|uniref:pseudouridylate synthase 7 homolog n=1 Tax=Ylistrum balloti TaxID=509963 RepID=UPI002905DD44|nr:pseudouridylate synthase 7 homolog [Ylistrum balloti]XP_060080965.1 pseudouridylate synthase 7 homolog [Ylistrum balloti]XP_060080966.1 pseudouridylate synthase 7 homolog [Ylistrum balloti]